MMKLFAHMSRTYISTKWLLKLKRCISRILAYMQIK